MVIDCNGSVGRVSFDRVSDSTLLTLDPLKANDVRVRVRVRGNRCK